jgi:ferric-dicitrate binding protein FerR (iron transport regulator)
MAFLKDDAYKQYAGELIEQQTSAIMDNHRLVDLAIRERLELRLQAILGAETPAIPVHQVHFLRRNRWWAAAAAIILLLGTGAYIYMSRSRSPKAELVQVKPEINVKKNVAPGGNKAMLILANGTAIILDSAANGQLAQQGKTIVSKLNNGQIVYAASNSPSTGGGRGEALYNTLSTPRGGQYQLVLPDGSIVWLNAASSIRYPTAFAGNEREVEVTGEAYFEVTKNAARPFRVKMNNGAAVEVLGTHFNINAYNDEPATKITLLEGRIKVSGKTGNVIIKPGQQARLTDQNNILKVDNDADVEEVMAWKNGAFQFGGADIQTVMRQISRWYDVEVEYQGNISLHFAGTMSRNVNISQVLEMLEKAGGLKTAVTGRKITVMP